MKFCIALFAVLAACSQAGAFTVEKNINSGKPPVEKLVIYDRAAPDMSAFKFKDLEGQAKMTVMPDKSLEVHFTGNKQSKPTFYIPGGPIDVKKYNYLLLTCRMNGKIIRDFNGRKSPTPWSKLWIGATFINSKNQRGSSANTDAVSPSGQWPSKTSTIQIPIMLMKNPAYGIDAPANAVAFQLTFGKTHNYMNRDLKLTIDKISLAE